MALITVDTNILIWGVRGMSNVGQESRIPICKRLFEWLQERQDKVVLTADCVEEYLVGGHPDQISTELAMLRKRFIILDYNPACWIKSAEIRLHANFVRQVREIDPGSTRVAIKADVRIVATAIVHKVGVIYSEDKGLQAIARRSGILCFPTPTIEDMAPNVKKPVSKPTQEKKLFPDLD